MEGFYNRNQGRPTNDDLVDFLRNDVEADLEELLHIQWNDLPTQRTVFLRFGTDEAATELEQKIAGNSAVTAGVPWKACGGKRLSGFKCGGSTIVVKIMYVSYEVPLDEVRKELEQYGIVRNINHSLIKIPGVDHLIQDGVIMARVTLNPGCKELPNWVRRPATRYYPAEVWRFQHRGQQPPGCWNCGDPRHIGKRCRVPLFGIEEQVGSTPVQHNRNATFTEMLKRNPPPPPKKRVVPEEPGTESDGETSVPQTGVPVPLPDTSQVAARVAEVAAQVQRVAAQIHATPVVNDSEVQVDRTEVAEGTGAQERIEVTDSVEAEVRVDEIEVQDVEMEEIGEDLLEDRLTTVENVAYDRVDSPPLGIHEVVTVEDNDLPVSQVSTPGDTGTKEGDSNVGEDVSNVRRDDVNLGGENTGLGGEDGRLPVNVTGQGGEDNVGQPVGDTGNGGDDTGLGEAAVGRGEGGKVPGVGDTDPGGGNMDPGGGNTDPGGGNTDPGGGGTDPGGTAPGGSHPVVDSGVVDSTIVDGALAQGVSGAAGVSQTGVESSGVSLPCGQGSGVGQEISQVGSGSQVEMMYMGAVEVLDENLRALTPSPRFLPTQEIKKEEIFAVISGEKYSQLSGGLAPGQGSSKTTILDPKKQEEVPVVDLSSSSSDIESSSEGPGIKRKKKNDKEATKQSKIQDGGSN